MNDVTFGNAVYTLKQEAFISDCGEKYQALAISSGKEYIIYWDVKQFDGGNDDVPEDEICDWENPSCVDELEISFDHDMGEYGIHDGFFNVVININGDAFHAQCCADDETIDFDDCGYDWGICEEVNAPLAEIVGWEGVKALLKAAFEKYSNK